MNDIILQDVPFKSDNGHRFFSRKSDKNFIYKQRYLNKSYEKKPLISVDSDSCSEDEITLHDIRHLKNTRTNTKNTSLRKINRNHSSERNGTVSGQRSDPFKHFELLDLKIEIGDTLQSISVKYCCTISDIKRANNLISDQEFYGLKYIKIPVRRHGLLTELLIPPVHKENSKNTTVVEETEECVQVINIGIGGRSPSPQETATFFKRMDEDLVKIMLSTQTQKDSLEAAAAALTTPQIQPLVKDPYNTVDCGIQWNYLLICVILLAIVLPLVLALYMYIKPSQIHHHDVYTSVSSNDSFNPVSKLNIKSKS